jgi:hypothetical protein
MDDRALSVRSVVYISYMAEGGNQLNNNRHLLVCRNYITNRWSATCMHARNVGCPATTKGLLHFGASIHA